jgi:hypothetical protein
MYEVTGSPLAGAFQVSITVLPLTEWNKPAGAPGAVAAAATVRSRTRDAEKQPGADDVRQLPRSAVGVTGIQLTASAAAGRPAADGAIGSARSPHEIMSAAVDASASSRIAVN